MTSKEKVINAKRGAYSVHEDGIWDICVPLSKGTAIDLGRSLRSESSAWAAAWKNIQRGQEEIR